ncbi:MBL fold metallo-hydrolase [Prauserella cavernicola]|uniref:MBL fold metallo-hydrolase n=1 Tax=Prauserella cavernicola TaxID=2800127 RepID=A0A934QU75_9PSEU|nr:MBL fold metallo-hydrolase [Prauserella cavernicola]MBK1785429.1 MBL fold metallo-hydrolase [Prauserella cavernicola]
MTVRVHHLNAGTMRPPGGRLVDGRPGLLRRSELVCHCLLVDTGSELVLVDTGIGLQGARRPAEWLGSQFVLLTNPARDEELTAHRQIERLGYSPSDVGHIVLTHLDLDHAGGLADFPQATVHVYGRELKALHSETGLAGRTRYRQAHFAHGPKFSAYDEDGDDWFGFASVRQLTGLPPEIVLVPLIGHTRGHAGVAVDTGKGWLLHAGDAYFFHGQLDPMGARHTPGLRVFERLVQTERGPRIENLHRLRALNAEHGDEVTVFSAHDATELERSLG